MKNKRVKLTEGFAYYINSKGERVGLTSLEEANAQDAKCCGLDCCNNWLTMPVKDTVTGQTFPTRTELIRSGNNVILQVTVDYGAGPVVRTVTLT